MARRLTVWSLQSGRYFHQAEIHVAGEDANSAATTGGSTAQDVRSAIAEANAEIGRLTSLKRRSPQQQDRIAELMGIRADLFKTLAHLEGTVNTGGRPRTQPADPVYVRLMHEGPSDPSAYVGMLDVRSGSDGEPPTLWGDRTLPDDTPVIYVDDEHPAPPGAHVQLWFDACADDCPGWIRDRERRAQQGAERES